MLSIAVWLVVGQDRENTLWLWLLARAIGETWQGHVLFNKDSEFRTGRMM